MNLCQSSNPNLFMVDLDMWGSYKKVGASDKKRKTIQKARVKFGHLKVLYAVTTALTEQMNWNSQYHYSALKNDLK